MIEIELAQIEDRIPTYPPQAQADIRWLARELRKLHNLGTRNAEAPASAIYDSLTGLLSGSAYGVRFAMARARAGRNKKIFAVILEDLSYPEQAHPVKQKIEAALAEPVKLGERAVRADSSISLQFYPTSRPADSKLH